MNLGRVFLLVDLGSHESICRQFAHIMSNGHEERNILCKKFCPAPPDLAARDLLRWTNQNRAWATVLILPESLQGALNLCEAMRDQIRRGPTFAILVTDDPDHVRQFQHCGFKDWFVPPLRALEVRARMGWQWLAPPVHEPDQLPEVLPGLVGDSTAVREALAMVRHLDPSDAPILITGESGTGKEVCARAIHSLSLRRNKPWVPVNCGSFAPELMANELFGHEQGAYTGAARSFRGLVAKAEGGTLFLDEIDSIPAHGQVKLLRFLQEGESRAVGACRTHKTDVRLVFATNGDLPQRVQDGLMREDFFYRLGPIRVHLPPLRDRIGDVPLLARHFLDKFARQYGKRIGRFSPEALQAMSNFHWPGNVRRLEQEVHRAVLLCPSDVVRIQDLQLDGPTASAACKSFRERRRAAMDQADKRQCELLLASHQGSVAQAALEAEMDYGNFYRLLRRHRLK